MHKRSLLATCVIILALLVASCGRDDDEGDAAAGSSTTTASTEACAGEELEATEIGITPETITIELTADVGSPLAPGLFQSNVDVMEAYAEYINEQGGIACRDLVVKAWDSKLTPQESKNGQIDACKTAFAMVGSNSVFNPDVTTFASCPDKAGKATGLPNVPALAVDLNEYCGETTIAIAGSGIGCPIKQGVQETSAQIGHLDFFEEQAGAKLKGLFMVPGDLPTTIQASTYQIAAQREAGVQLEALKYSAADAQSAFTPKVQVLKSLDANFVFNGGNDRGMVNMRKEARAQGVDSVKVWVCYACYTQPFLKSGGSDVEGTYIPLGFLPFEEADTNETLNAFVESVGGPTKADSLGSQGWHAAMLFKEAVDRIVEEDGPNALTRARLLETLRSIDDFDAGGWLGEPAAPGTFRSCLVILQVRDGEFVRVHPKERGTLDCDPKNVAKVSIDPAAEAAKIP